MRCTVSGSNLAHFMFGGESKSFEPGFEVEARRQSARVGADADTPPRHGGDQAANEAATR